MFLSAKSDGCPSFFVSTYAWMVTSLTSELSRAEVADTPSHNQYQGKPEESFSAASTER